MEEVQRKPITVEERTESNRVVHISKKTSNKRINHIMQEVSSHLGQYALLYVEDKREMVPRLVEIMQITKYLCVCRYKVYYPSGMFRCYLYTSVGYTSLYCGDRMLTYFDDDI
jgi:hypothetical protein